MSYTATDVMFVFVIGLFVGAVITTLILLSSKTWKPPKEGGEGFV